MVLDLNSLTIYISNDNGQWLDNNHVMINLMKWRFRLNNNEQYKQ